MITRFLSTPPHTLGTVKPAFSARSMNWTGDVGGVVAAASTRNRSPSLHSGVVSVSSKPVPRTKSEDPRKRRRGTIICWFDYREPRLTGSDSSASHLWKWMRNHACPFFDRNDRICRDIGQLVDL